MRHRIFDIQPYLLLLLSSCAIFCRCAEKPQKGPLPKEYQQAGSFIKTLPYYNPDSCVLLIKRDVPLQWQGAAYQNLFLDGPEDSPMELGYRHLDTYEENFPADSARAFAQLYRGLLLGHENRMDSAVACVNDAYAISQRAGIPLLAFDAQLQLAAFQIKEGKTAEPIRAYLAAYDAVKDMDSSQTDRKIWVMNLLASAYSITNNHRMAMDWLQRCYPLVEDESVPSLLSGKVDHFMRKAVIYNRLELPDSAILMAQKGLDLQEKTRPTTAAPR